MNVACDYEVLMHIYNYQKCSARAMQFIDITSVSFHFTVTTQPEASAFLNTDPTMPPPHMANDEGAQQSIQVMDGQTQESKPSFDYQKL